MPLSVDEVKKMIEVMDPPNRLAYFDELISDLLTKADAITVYDDDWMFSRMAEGNETHEDRCQDTGKCRYPKAVIREELKQLRTVVSLAAASINRIRGAMQTHGSHQAN